MLYFGGALSCSGTVYLGQENKIDNEVTNTFDIALSHLCTSCILFRTSFSFCAALDTTHNIGDCFRGRDTDFYKFGIGVVDSVTSEQLDK